MSRGRHAGRNALPTLPRRIPAPTAVAAAALAVAAAVAVPQPAVAGNGGCIDALHARVGAELSGFTGWLVRNRAGGIIGEVGWPDPGGDTDRWGRLAGAWFEQAAGASLPVVVWATGEWWGTDYPLAAYQDSDGRDGVDDARPQAAVLEAARVPWRGVSVAGAEFGAPQTGATSGFSNRTPGAYDRAYHYDGAATFTFLARRGLDTVRIPFRWERIQPDPGQPLDGAEVDRLRAAVDRAHAVGLRVVLDVHNFGGYYLWDGSRGVRTPIGAPDLPVARFADLWRRLAGAFGNHPGVVAYGLMNEPVDLPGGAGTWEAASQAAVDGVRAAGDGTPVLVAGYAWSGVRQWADVHPSAWIDDPVDRVRYEAHHYWDRDGSGHYQRSYAEEVQDARSRGYGCERWPPPGERCQTTTRRLAGPERVATAVAVSRSAWPEAPAVVLARADDPADALTGTALAGRFGAPLLTTPGDHLPDRLRAELSRLRVRTVWLLGGPAAIGPAVAERLRSDGLAVRRLAGPDRFATAAAVADALGARGSAVVVRGAAPDPARAWPDALAVSGLAATEARAGRAAPVLLVSSELPQATLDAVTTHGVERANLFGGPVAIPDRVADDLARHGVTVARSAGPDRYATSTAVADRTAAGACAPVILVSGATFADGLPAGALAGRLGATLLLTAPERLPDAAVGWLDAHADHLGDLLVVGGEQAVGDRVMAQARSVLGR